MPARITSFFSSVAAKAKSAYAWGLAHKVWSGVIIAAALGGGYFGYTHYFTTSGTTQYVLAEASRGNLVVTISGSGQVAANQELSLAPKASGEVTYVGVKAGDVVRAGTVIAYIDSTDAAKTLRDAQANLVSAQISYEQALASANTSSSKAVDTALSSSATAISDLSGIIRDLDSVLHDISVIPVHTSQQNVDAYASIIGGAQGRSLADQAEASYVSAKSAYQAALSLSTQVSRSSSGGDIKKLIAATYDAAAAASQATSDTHDILTMVNDRLIGADTKIPASFTATLTTATSDLTKANADTSSTLSAKTALESAQATLSDSATPLDIQSAELSLQRAQNAVTDARTTLSDYAVVAPFAGTIAKVNVQTHDQAGGSMAVATLVTNEQFAQLSLNEVDAAKVKTGQKASLTFDAVDGLTLSGTVAEVDTVGTVSQGVVTYDVKISFDTQDPRVRPGMTVNATIVADSKANALIVPSSAVETTGGRSFVQVVTAGAPAMQNGPAASTTGFNRTRTASSTNAFAQTGAFASTTGRFRVSSTTANSFAAGGAALRSTQTVNASTVTVTRVPVEVGLTNDTQTEIVSGITDGTVVVSRTTTATATAAASAATGAARTTTGGNRGFGGGGAAVLRGG